MAHVKKEVPVRNRFFFQVDIDSACRKKIERYRLQVDRDSCSCRRFLACQDSRIKLGETRRGLLCLELPICLWSTTWRRRDEDLHQWHGGPRVTVRVHRAQYFCSKSAGIFPCDMCDRGQKLLQQIAGTASTELARRKIFSDSWRYSSFSRTALHLHIHELLLNRVSFLDFKFRNLDQTVAVVGLLMISNHN